MKGIILNKSSQRSSEEGLSAIELLIAMGVFLIVMSSVYGILKIGNMSRSTVNTRSENIKNVRMAINSIGREAVNAGLGYNRIGGMVPDDFTTDNFGLPADTDTDPDLLTAISAGNDISESDFSKNGEKNDVMAFAFRDFQFNDGYPIEIKDATEKDGQLILKTPNGACANCRPYDLFLIETSDGKQAVILSTDIIGNNQIILGGTEDPININYGKKGKKGKDTQKQVEDAQKKVSDAQKELADHQQHLAEAILKADLKKIAEEQKKITDSLQLVATAQQLLTSLLAALTGSGTPSAESPVKKCTVGVTSNCISYGSTLVVAKKIYLVSYNINGDGTLIRTTYGNNTGATGDEQVVRQPIANGVRSMKIKYLLSDGSVTEDPSVANTQKERCNEIVQLEVTLVVEAEAGQNSLTGAEPITLTSTFSTRNLKYDVY